MTGRIDTWSGNVTDYSSISYWLETCGDDLTPRPSLAESIDVDIAIMGAGYSGLWTAYYLKQRDPSLAIATAPERPLAVEPGKEADRVRRVSLPEATS